MGSRWRETAGGGYRWAPSGLCHNLLRVPRAGCYGGRPTHPALSSLLCPPVRRPPVFGDNPGLAAGSAMPRESCWRGRWDPRAP